MISIYDVLKASKGIHVDDTFAELWGRKLSNAYTVATYTGTLPAVLTGTEAGYLHRYKICGNTEQNGTPTPENPIEPSECGERTVNLYNINAKDINNGYVNNAQLTQDGTVATWGSAEVSEYIPINGDTAYTFNGIGSYNSPCYALYDENKQLIGAYRYNGANIIRFTSPSDARYFRFTHIKIASMAMLVEGSYTSSTMPEYEPYGYKLPLTVNGVEYPIYLDDAQLAKDEYVDSTTGKIYRRTKNLSPPEEEWVDGQIGGGDGTVHPSTQIKVSPFIDVSTCETCIMEVFSTETEWAAAGYREMAFYDENKQYLGWIGGGGRQTLTPNSSERLSEFPAGTVYVRIGCSHGDQPFYPQLVSGYTPTHQFYPYLVPTDPPAPFPQIPTFAGTTVIDYNGEPKPDKVELTYRKRKGQ